MTLPPHYPSSPTRPPSHHIYFTIRDPEGEQVRFFTHGYGAPYAAWHWADAIYTACTDAGCTVNWKSDDTITFTHPSGYSLTLKEHDLQNLLEFEPNKEEKAWTPPYPDSAELERTKVFWEMRPMSSYPSTTSQPEEQPTSTSEKPKPSAPKRHKTQKPAPDGSITVAQIAEQQNIQPNKARNILRKANIQKPAGGWTFKTTDPMVKTITDLLNKG